MKCSNCFQNAVHRMLNDRPICSACITHFNYVACAGCGKYTTSWNLRNHNGTYRCGECAEAYCYCRMCNTYVKKSSAHVTVTSSDESEYVCSNCVTRAHPCSDCYTWIPVDTTYCSRCAPKHTQISCAKCGELVSLYDSHKGILDVQSDGKSGVDRTRVCTKCYAEYSKYLDNIDGYEDSDEDGYTGDYIFKGRAKIFFGVELEFELAKCDEMKAIMAIDFSKNDRLIKHDGSLRSGVELISMPCSLRYHKQSFGWDTLCKSLKKLGCSTKERCGLHVHMSRKITEGHEKKLYSFTYRHMSHISKIAGRQPSNYCHLPNDYDEEYRDTDRYEVLNFSNDNTIEFRLPKGTLEYKQIYAVLEYCDAALRYTRSKSYAFIKTMPWEAFVDWVKKPINKTTYPNLLKLLKSKRIRTGTPTRRTRKTSRSIYA